MNTQLESNEESARRRIEELETAIRSAILHLRSVETHLSAGKNFEGRISNREAVQVLKRAL